MQDGKAFAAGIALARRSCYVGQRAWPYLAVMTSSPVRAAPGDLAAISAASNLDGDPQDARAVAAVCTVCHAASQFLTTPRVSSRWEQVYPKCPVMARTEPMINLTVW